MKKLEQIGLVDVQPGGARVRAKEEASLDVIGHMLGQQSIPDAKLVDQILVVVSNLVSMAAEQALEYASEAELQAIRDATTPFRDESLDLAAHGLARFELMHAIMMASRNLPLRLIVRTLLEQFIPHTTILAEYADQNLEAYALFARQLDQALANRDLPALRASFEGMSTLNRETVMQAIARANSSANTHRVEAALS